MSWVTAAIAAASAGSAGRIIAARDRAPSHPGPRPASPTTCAGCGAALDGSICSYCRRRAEQRARDDTPTFSAPWSPPPAPAPEPMPAPAPAPAFESGGGGDFGGGGADGTW